MEPFDVLSINWNVDPWAFPFLFFKNFDYFAQQENVRLWDQSCAPLKDGNELSNFGMWPSETFLIKDYRMTPRVYWSYWNLMTNLYNEAILGFERSPKEFAWETNIRCLGIFHELLVKWAFFSNVHVWTLVIFLLSFFIFFFQQSEACIGSIPESQL